MTESQHPRIVCAAMLMQDGEIITGIRHFSPEMRKSLLKIYGEKYHLKVKTQGFVDSQGNFLNRREAWERALQTNQILKELGTTGKLFSENLY